jgi:hypothetical protein
MGRLRTNRKSRRLKNLVVVFVDGKTEIAYLKHVGINQRNNVRFDLKKGDERDFENHLSDEIPHLIVLDIDGITRQNDPKKRYERVEWLIDHSGRANDIFYNNYAFETFLLMHVTDDVPRVMSGSGYDTPMKKYFGIHQSWHDNKSDRNVQAVLAYVTDKSFEEAIKRSMACTNAWNRQPSSNMHAFFKHCVQAKC